MRHIDVMASHVFPFETDKVSTVAQPKLGDLSLYKSKVLSAQVSLLSCMM